MRVGVLDVGSNTVHLLVVDAHRGGHPTPMTSEKTQLRLAEHLDGDGRITARGADALVETVRRAKRAAAAAECAELLAFATSALRDAGNSAAVLQKVAAETGVGLQVLPGEDEARYTFLAVRRWYGWSAGRLLVLDISGGSLEMAAGRDEDPDVAVSLPLGAGRLHRRWFGSDPPSRAEMSAVTAHLDEALGPVAQRVRKPGEFELVVGTSKTFRSLARLTGAAPSGAGLRTCRRSSNSPCRRSEESPRRRRTNCRRDDVRDRRRPTWTSWTMWSNGWPTGAVLPWWPPATLPSTIVVELGVTRDGRIRWLSVMTRADPVRPGHGRDG